MGGLTLPVQLQAGRISDPQLSGDVLGNLRGNVGRVSEECTQEPHRPQLNPEAQAIGITPPLLYELSVGVVQEEGPLQLCPGERSSELAVSRYLLVGEEFNRHARSTDAMPARGTRLARLL